MVIGIIIFNLLKHKWASIGPPIESQLDLD